MSYTVGMKELRRHAGAILKRVTAGEVIDVTQHGHPIARIVPLHGSTLDQLVAEGRATEAEGDLLELMDDLNLPARLAPSEHSPTAALAELRRDER